MAKIPSREFAEKITANFGNLDSDGYQKLRANREDLINSIMGQIEGYNKLLLDSHKENQTRFLIIAMYFL
jgi:hypothetical protein